MIAMQTHTKYGVLLLVGIILPGVALAEQSDVGAFTSRIINEFPARFLSDANETFTNPNNIIPLLAAGGASIAMHSSDADKNLNDNLDRHRAFDDTSDKIFDYAGNPGIHLGATGLWYLFSAGKENRVEQERAWTMLSALAVTDAATFGLKAVVNNDRPNGHNFSFPSAHTASSFCVASVLDEYYGSQVGVPAYIGACLVGWRMMDSGDHWASDVLFGGTLGYIVGHSVADKHKQLEVAGFQIEPMIDLGVHPASGIALVKRF